MFAQIFQAQLQLLVSSHYIFLLILYPHSHTPVAYTVTLSPPFISI